MALAHQSVDIISTYLHVCCPFFSHPLSFLCSFRTCGQYQCHVAWPDGRETELRAILWALHMRC